MNRSLIRFILVLATACAVCCILSAITADGSTHLHAAAQYFPVSGWIA